MTEIISDEPDTELPGGQSHSAWLPIFATLYDPLLWLGEIAGMRRRRRTLLAEAYGCVVEIGAGTGLNLTQYPDGLDELIVTEPEPAMRGKLARRIERCASSARIVNAPAERLPLGDASVDTVVSTLVLCTVNDPEKVLREIARVLRPDGRLLFIEHVRAGSRFIAAVQDKLRKPWHAFAGGCVCNRQTVQLMSACGFTVEVDDQVWRGMPPIVRPLAVGRATR